MPSALKLLSLDLKIAYPLINKNNFLHIYLYQFLGKGKGQKQGWTKPGVRKRISNLNSPVQRLTLFISVTAAFLFGHQGGSPPLLHLVSPLLAAPIVKALITLY